MRKIYKELLVLLGFCVVATTLYALIPNNDVDAKAVVVAKFQDLGTTHVVTRFNLKYSVSLVNKNQYQHIQVGDSIIIKK